MSQLVDGVKTTLIIRYLRKDCTTGVWHHMLCIHLDECIGV